MRGLPSVAVRQVTDLSDHITISVSGVGSLYPRLDSRLATMGYLSSKEINELRCAGAYGDIVLRYIDSEGAECASSLAGRTLAISLDQYRRIPLKIVAAAGKLKAHTLLAVLRGRLVDALVLDAELARATLGLNARLTLHDGTGIQCACRTGQQHSP